MTSVIQQLAKQMLEYEAQHALAPLSQIDIALRVCEKLRIHLSTLVGNVGYHELVTRALVLIKRDHPWAESLKIDEDGSLKIELPPAANRHAHLMTSEAVAVPTQLLNLLSIFIGETLTCSIAHEIWPTLPSDAAPNNETLK